MRLHLLLLCFLLPQVLPAQVLSGVVRDSSGSILPFATITVSGTARGVTANAEGRYNLHLDAGSYSLICEHVGYVRSVRNITLKGDDSLNFRLSPRQLMLQEIIIGTGEDPAYAIIRHTIRERVRHRKELESFQCMVYSKGKAGLYNTPKSFMGQKIPTDTNYIGKNATIYMSEVVARYAESPPDKQRVEVISTKVSGQSNGYGATLPFLISFYDNVIQLGNMNPRGFISPISENALHYYKYKLVGTYMEDGRRIDQIRVTPKRTYEPCWAGIINIIDKEWRIHSTDLLLTKTAQLELLDTFHLQQLYATLDTQTWVMRSQVGYFAFNLFGFNGGGSVANIYSDFEVHPSFPKNYFSNIAIKYDDGSNKKSESYWDTIRPLPLTPRETRDYHLKDSLEKIQSTSPFQDSLDRSNSKITPLALFLTGITITHTRKHESISLTPLTQAVGFNTVEGPFAHLLIGYQKEFGTRQVLEIHPDVRYGFSNEHWGVGGTVKYEFNKKYHSTLEAGGGKTVFQYDPEEPISPLLNTAYTLFEVANYMKLYEASYGRIRYSKELGTSGLRLSLGGEWQDRVTLANTDTGTYWIKAGGKPGFTSNYPPPFASAPMGPNKAASVSFTLVWHPGMKYMEFPESLVALGSKYPTVTFTYTKGLPGFLGSTADFDKWKLSVQDDINLKIGGLFRYNLNIGGFINSRTVALPDYNHIQGNQTDFATNYMDQFQIAPYYLYSNTDKFYFTGFAEHHFAGLLTNKIPLFRRLDWYLVGGVHYLYLSDGRTYTEIAVGLENIFKVLRVDYLWGLPSNGGQLTGLTIGVKIGP